MLDLSSLAACMGLQHLDCDGTHVLDLGPLAACVELQTLHCEATNVEQLTPLAACTRLTTLRCRRTPVSDLGPLAACACLFDLCCDRSVGLERQAGGPVEGPARNPAPPALAHTFGGAWAPAPPPRCAVVILVMLWWPSGRLWPGDAPFCFCHPVLLSATDTWCSFLLLPPGAPFRYCHPVLLLIATAPTDGPVQGVAPSPGTTATAACTELLLLMERGTLAVFCDGGWWAPVDRLPYFRQPYLRLLYLGDWGPC